MTRSRGTAAALATAFAVGAIACSHRTAIDRALRARGGFVGAVATDAVATVHRGFPGEWHWRRTFAPPDRYAWTIFTTREPIHHLFDGTVIRAFVGVQPTAEDLSPDAALRSQARFVAVMLLDVLLAPGMHVEPVSRESLPTGASAGVTVAFPGSDERYAVMFDEALRPIHVEGFVDLAPVGRGRLVARQDDFRLVAGRLLPHHVTYELDGTPLAEERALAICVLDAPLPVEAFSDPARLPDCRPHTEP